MENESISQWVDTEGLRALAEDLMRDAPESDDNSGEGIYGSGFVGFAESETIPIPAPPVTEEVVVESPPPRPRVAGPEVPPEVDAVPAPAVDEVERRPAPSRNESQAPEVDPMPVARFKSPFKIAGPPVPRPPAARPPAKPRAPEASARPQSLATRLNSFGNWLKEDYPAEAYFLCDRNGKAIVDEVGSEKLLKVALALAHASSGGETPTGSSSGSSGLHVKVGPDRVMEVIPRKSRFGLLTLGILVPRPLSSEAVATVSDALGKVLGEPGSTPGE